MVAPRVSQNFVFLDSYTTRSVKICIQIMLGTGAKSLNSPSRSAPERNLDLKQICWETKPDPWSSPNTHLYRNLSCVLQIASARSADHRYISGVPAGSLPRDRKLF